MIANASTHSAENRRIFEFDLFIVRSALIPPGQTFTVRANCFIPSNIVEGTKDRVTLSAQGLTTVTQSLVLTVKSPNTVSTVSCSVQMAAF